MNTPNSDKNSMSHRKFNENMNNSYCMPFLTLATLPQKTLYIMSGPPGKLTRGYFWPEFMHLHN